MGGDPFWRRQVSRFPSVNRLLAQRMAKVAVAVLLLTGVLGAVTAVAQGEFQRNRSGTLSAGCV